MQATQLQTLTLLVDGNEEETITYTNETFSQIQEKYRALISIPRENQYWFLRHGLKVYFPKMNERLSDYLLHKSSVIMIVDKTQYNCTDNSIRTWTATTFKVMGLNIPSKTLFLPINLSMTISDFVSSLIAQGKLESGRYNVIHHGEKLVPYKTFFEVPDALRTECLFICRYA